MCKIYRDDRTDNNDHYIQSSNIHVLHYLKKISAILSRVNEWNLKKKNLFWMGIDITVPKGRGYKENNLYVSPYTC